MKKNKIVILDDNPSIVLLLKNALNQNDRTFFKFYHLDKMLKQLPEIKPDLIILDVRIGFLNSLNYLNEIKDYSLIFITGCYGEELKKVKSAVTSYGIQVFSKPFNFDVFNKAVSDILQQDKADN